MSGHPRLQLRHVGVRYGRATEAVRDVELTLPAGGSAVVLGPNGAGKSSLVRAVAGFEPTVDATVTGSVLLDGVELRRLAPERRARMGVVTVHERDKVFRTLTVEENLRIAGRGRHRGRRAVAPSVAYDAFPQLAAHRTRRAGYLSGGEQRMLALAGAFLARPKLLVVDEPSLGLAPILVATVAAALEQIRDELGVTVLLVEQNVWAAQLADQVLTMSGGTLRAHDDGIADPRLLAADYLRVPS